MTFKMGFYRLQNEHFFQSERIVNDVTHMRQNVITRMVICDKCLSDVNVGEGVNFCRVSFLPLLCENARTGKTSNSVGFFFHIVTDMVHLKFVTSIVFI